jgi:hypothetical protein
MDEVALGQNFLRALRLSPVIYHSASTSYSSVVINHHDLVQSPLLRPQYQGMESPETPTAAYIIQLKLSSER